MNLLLHPWLHCHRIVFLHRHRIQVILYRILRQQLRKEKLPVVYAHQQSGPTQARIILPLILYRWKLHLSSNHNRHFGSNIIRKRLDSLAPNLQINDDLIRCLRPLPR